MHSCWAHAENLLMLYFSLMRLNLRRALYPRGIWKDFSTDTHLIKCFCSFGCLVAVGCVFLLSLTPFPCPLPKGLTTKKIGKAVKGIYTFTQDQSQFFFVFVFFAFHKTNNEMIRWLSEMHQYTSSCPLRVFVVGWFAVSLWPKSTTFLPNVPHFPLSRFRTLPKKQAEKLFDWFPKIGGLVIV